jgi:uncharacterized protein with ParB-like and HNH nuclease domain
MSELKRRTIASLMGEHFFIPSYQRGYRWTGTQVTELLNDILEFTLIDRTPDAFYCLQPIVVKDREWEKDGKTIQGWELVDGQQRLTTIWILLNYLEREVYSGKTLKGLFFNGEKDIFSIDYQTRKDTSSFLKNLFDKTTPTEKTELIEIDPWHIQESYKNIGIWFSNHPYLKEEKPEKKLILNDLYEYILRPLIYDSSNKKTKEYGTVQIIWYQTEEKNPIATFRRLNAGKIPLTNADLIKALFLQKRNFAVKASTDSNGSVDDGIYLHQLQIATKWDNIENTLHDENFWLFLTNKKDDTSASRIGFIFDLIKDMELKDKTDEEKNKFGDDGYVTFRYFYQTIFDNNSGIKAIKETWKTITDYFNTFEEWFNDSLYYHYIGFLVYCDEPIINIYNTCKNGDQEKSPIKNKKDVEDVLIRLISSRYKNIKIESLQYGSHDRIIRELLLLYNIQIIIEQNKNNQIKSRFPFSSFKNLKKAYREDGDCSWDIEHIDSYTENPLEDKKDQKAWLEDCELAIKQIKNELTSLNLEAIDTKEIDTLLVLIENYVSLPDSFDDLYYKIQNFFGERVDGESDETEIKKKNSIGNLTLLDSGTNRSYKNAVFPRKRERIIKEEKAGTFVPLGTRNVFLKYFEESGNSRTRWTNDDIELYRKDIEEKLEIFFKKG